MGFKINFHNRLRMKPASPKATGPLPPMCLISRPERPESWAIEGPLKWVMCVKSPKAIGIPNGDAKFGVKTMKEPPEFNFSLANLKVSNTLGFSKCSKRWAQIMKSYVWLDSFKNKVASWETILIPFTVFSEILRLGFLMSSLIKYVFISNGLLDHF